MSDIFISYSRVDSDFGRRLHTALTEQKREVWMDWKDIPLTATWWNEIKEGIEASDNFVLIMSPHSIGSPICQMEIAYAVQYNKRIVPILYADPDKDNAFVQMMNRARTNDYIQTLLNGRDILKIASDNWVELAARNWIVFQPKDDFDVKFIELNHALDLDLAHVKQHTRLLLRAIEWDNRGRNPRHLLSGNDISEAEQWQAQGQQKKPLPTVLHAQYILASRTQQRRFLGTMVGLMASLTLVAVVGATFAFIQARIAQDARNEALTQRDRANEQTILSRSRELAAAALLSTDSQADRAVLLGLQAIATSPTFEARNSLLVAMQSQRNIVGYLNGHTDQVRAVVLNPDKTLLATGSRNGEIIIWDMATRQAIQHLEGHTGRVNAIAFNADGSLMASTGFNGQLFVWDTVTWRQRHVLTWVENPSSTHGWSLAFAPNGNTLALGDSLGQVLLWDAESGEVLNTLNVVGSESGDEDKPVYSLAFHPDGSMLATGGGNNRVKLWDTTNWEIIAEFTDHTNWVLDLAFSSDGHLLASSSADTTIRFWDTQTLTGLCCLTGHENGVRSILFANNDRNLISTDVNGVVIVNDLRDSQNTFSINSPENTPVWAIDLKDGNLIIGGETDSVFMISLVNQPTFPFNHIVGTSENPIMRVAFSPDGTQIATGGAIGDFNITLWNLESGDNEIIEEHQSVVSDLVWDGSRLVSVDFDGLVVIWENGLIRTFEIGEPILSVDVHNDMVALGDSQGDIHLWNISDSPTEVATFTAHESLVLTLDFSPDGRQLVSGGRDGKVWLWEVATQKSIGIPFPIPGTGHSDDVLAVTFSPDGQYVASGSRDKTIIIWEVATGQPIATPLTGHTNWVTNLAYSPDGHALVSSSTDMTLRMWDTQSLRQLGLPLNGDNNFVQSVDYSIDGKWIVSAGEGGSILLWNASLEDWERAACVFANRPLSASEQQEYFTGAFPALNVCPLNG